MTPPSGFTAARFLRLLIAGGLLLAGAIVLGLAVGSVPLSPLQLLTSFGGDGGAGAAIIRDVRLPRVLLAACVGAGLGVSGNALQVLLRNPLAEPYVLGISNGCAVGVIAGTLAHFGTLGLALCGFAGGMLVTVLVFRWSTRGGVLSAESLLLAGVMVGALGAAIIFLALAVAGDPMRAAIGWLLGNLGGATWSDLPVAAVVVIAATLVLARLALPLNALAVGTEFAAQAGVAVERVQRMTYVVSALIVGTLVALVGAVGFVGLVIPHLVRARVGADNRLVVPGAFLAGAACVVLADALSRVVVPGTELPIGAVTALLGAPVYLWVLRRPA